MLSLRDCLDYCDLTDDEVRLLAHHEHLEFPEAAQLALCLIQSNAGTQALRHIIDEEVATVMTEGGTAEFIAAERAFIHFNRYHPPFPG